MKIEPKIRDTIERILQTVPPERWKDDAWGMFMDWNAATSVPLDEADLRDIFNAVSVKAIAFWEQKNRSKFGEPELEEKELSITVRIQVTDGTAVFVFTEILQHNDGIDAILECSLEQVGVKQQIFDGRLNLISLSGRESFARQLAKAFGKTLAWELLLASACSAVRNHLKNIDNSGWMETHPPSHSEYLIAPFILKNAPNILFGKGSSGKTFLTLRMLMSLATGTPFMGAETKEKTKSLYIDYESSGGAMVDRLFRLGGGMGNIEFPMESIRYMNPRGVPLHEMVKSIKKIIVEHGIGLIVIDSAALASGGEPEKAETAIRYFNALNAIGVTSLTIAHETKQENSEYPFGSAFYYHEPRNIWNVKRVQEQEEDVIHIGLMQRKANEDRLSKPYSARVYFGAGFVEVNQESTEWMPESENTSQKICRYLRENHWKTPKEITNGIGAPNSNPVYQALHRLKSSGIVQEVVGKYDMTENTENGSTTSLTPRKGDGTQNSIL